MEILAAFATGLLAGGSAVYFLTRDAARRVERVADFVAGALVDQRADAAAAREGYRSLTLELAHKLSAPEQAAVDHIFDKDRQVREQEAARREAQMKADAVDATLKQYGIEADELVAPLPDPDMELMSP